jgi:hypothetical protein
MLKLTTGTDLAKAGSAVSLERLDVCGLRSGHLPPTVYLLRVMQQA